MGAVYDCRILSFRASASVKRPENCEKAIVTSNLSNEIWDIWRKLIQHP
jgi:hypothetical protein